MNPRRPGPGGVNRGRGGGASGGGSSESIPILENWEVLPDGRVKGAVYGRKGFTEGQEITTGAVVKRTSTEVTTNSGSRSMFYLLCLIYLLILISRHLPDFF